MHNRFFAIHRGAKSLIVALVAVLCLTSIPQLTAQEATQAQPQSAGDLSVGLQLTPVQLETALARIRAARQILSLKVDNNPPSPPGLEMTPGRESLVSEIAVELDPSVDSHAPTNALVIGRNSLNTRANIAGGSTLAEPAAANEGIEVFYGGNTHFEYSTNGGTTWTNVPIPAGPADAPTPCCDPDVIYDRARGVIFWSVLYVNGAGTNGVVRIFVRRNTPNSPDSCSYTFDVAGAANNILPDYPHLGIGNHFLYLSLNNVNIIANAWTGAQMRKYSADQMADCVAASGAIFTYGPGGAPGQRVFVPVEGAKDVMYFASLDNATTFRIFRWPEGNPAPLIPPLPGAVSQFTRAITASTFTNPDCRGGTGNFDWIGATGSTTAYSIAGFRIRGAVGHGTLGAGRISWYWNVGPDASHTQGHVHSAVFNESSLALIAQPHIFNNAFCFGFPSVAANTRGDLGISLGSGGRLGGGGTAAQGFVGVDDDFTSGVGFPGTYTLTAAGTANRTDNRFGDYFTTRLHSPCEYWFVSTNYALNGGNGLANVNARYVEYGRGQTRKCYGRFRSLSGTP